MLETHWICPFQSLSVLLLIQKMSMIYHILGFEGKFAIPIFQVIQLFEDLAGLKA